MLAVGEHLWGDQIDRNLVKIANGFAGGIAGTHEHVCGALTGGIILLGYLYGRSDASGSDDPVYQRVKGYRERFLAEIGGYICKDLRDNGPYGPNGPSSCRILMGQAAALLLEFLD